MPPRKTAKKKAVAVRVKRVARKSARKAPGKPPAAWTYGDMQKFLKRMEKWWLPLHEDVTAVEKLIRKIPPRRPLSPETKREFKRLMAKVRKARTCAYPPVDQVYCLDW